MCQHLLEDYATKSRLYFVKKSLGTCDICDEKGPNIWACLSNDCTFVGCGGKKHDHAGTHQKKQHPVAINLNTFRVWCDQCKKEIKLTGSYSCSEMISYKASLSGKDTSGRNMATQKVPTENCASNDMACGGGRQFRALSTLQPLNPLKVAESSRGLTGLKNLGNTCYMNAAIQSLSNCPQLTNYFLSLMKLHEDSLRKLSVSRRFTKLMMDMWNQRYPALSPNEVRCAFIHLNPQFGGGHQQDVQEFLRCFVDNLQEEMKNELPVIEDDCDNQVKKLVIKEAGGDACSKSPNQAAPQKQHSEAILSEDTTTMEMMDVDTADETPEEHDTLLSDDEYRPSLSHNELHSSAASANSSPVATANISAPNLQSTPTNHEEELDDPSPRSAVKRRRTMSASPCHQNASKSQEKLFTYKKKTRKVESTSLISDVFDGALRSSVQCRTCYMLSHTEETFQDLSLPIPSKDDAARIHGLPPPPPPPLSHGIVSQTDQGYSTWLWSFWDRWRSAFASWMWGPEVHLNDCLSAFFSADELKGDNMYSCEKCTKLRNGVKECKLLRLPEVLCVHLKRFRHESLATFSSKVSTIVKFPLQGLNMSRYLADDSSSEVRSYDLFSVIVHAGGSGGGGHYTSFTKNPLNGNWYEFDDSYVTEVDESVVANAEAYVLFYRKQEKSEDDIVWIRETLYELENEPKLASFYIAVEWMAKLFSFAEPGPIDNRYFMCPHGDVDPTKYEDIEQRVCRVSEKMWHLLHQKFGGSPVVTRLQSCSICERDNFLLEEKRRAEYNMFVKLSESANNSTLPTFYISMAWFRSWQHFICGKEREPPSEIDNKSILVEKGGTRTLNKNGDYGEIPLDAWEYLLSQYQGGPPVPASVDEEFEKD